MSRYRIVDGSPDCVEVQRKCFFLWVTQISYEIFDNSDIANLLAKEYIDEKLAREAAISNRKPPMEYP